MKIIKFILSLLDPVTNDQIGQKDIKMVDGYVIGLIIEKSKGGEK